MILGQNGALSLFYRSTGSRAEERRAMLFSVFVFVMLVAPSCWALASSSGLHGTTTHGLGSGAVYPYLALSLLIAFAGLPEALQQAVNRPSGKRALHAFQLTAWAINTGFTLYFVVALHQARWIPQGQSGGAAAHHAGGHRRAREALGHALLVLRPEALPALRPAAGAALLRRLDADLLSTATFSCI